MINSEALTSPAHARRHPRAHAARAVCSSIRRCIAEDGIPRAEQDELATARSKPSPANHPRPRHVDVIGAQSSARRLSQSRDRAGRVEREIGHQENADSLRCEMPMFRPHPSSARLSSEGADSATPNRRCGHHSAVPAVHIRRSNYDWYQRLLALLGDFQAEAPAQAPIQAPSLEGIPVFVAKNPSSNA